MKNKGITLVALVVTIVIMLILAGVTLNLAIGDNGLFKMAEKTVDEYQAEGEREALEMSVATYQLGKNTGSEETEIEEGRLGDTLLDKGLDNQDSWHEVQTTDDKKWHGTGWNLVEEGDDLGGYGKAQHSWLVNYETGEIKKLEKDKYKSVTIHDTIAVEDNLILNLDSAMTDEGVDNKQDSIEKKLGEGVTLNNFTYGTTDGLINNEFIFDGDNDYIDLDFDKIKIEGNTERENWLGNGFTLEFYGTISGGKVKGVYGDEYGTDLGSVETEGVGGRNSGILDCRPEEYPPSGNRTLSLVVDSSSYAQTRFTLFIVNWCIDEDKYGGDKNSSRGAPYGHDYDLQAHVDRRLLLYTFY